MTERLISISSGIKPFINKALLLLWQVGDKLRYEAGLRIKILQKERAFRLQSALRLYSRYLHPVFICVADYFSASLPEQNSPQTSLFVKAAEAYPSFFAKLILKKLL